MVTRSLDLFLTTPLTIVGETSLYVRHNLLRKVDSLDGIGAVCAHPQALAQCHAWLSHHLPARRAPAGGEQRRRRAPGRPRRNARRARERARGERVRPVRRRAGDPGRCPQPHPLRDPRRIPASHPQPKASGHDCTSLVVSVANRPGAVHDMLQPLKAHGVSMTRFESRPARSGQWEYYFYVDLDGHPDQPQRRPRARGAARGVRVLQAARHLSCRRPLGHCPPMFEQLGVIGCGLMGGSFALALKRAGLVRRVIGYSKSPSTTEQAKRLGVIDTAAESALLAVSGSDIVLLAVPVLGDRGDVQGDPPPRRAGHAADGRRLDQARRRRRRPARPEGPHRLVRSGASDRRQGGVGDRPRRRHALPGPPGDPDAAAEDHARAGPEGDRRLGRRSARRCCA